ncbi:arp2/3 complex subunit, putative [Leishmania tarentolae]|uniref:Arp2/3 complex subunit, putative n=1 Tax=Leishmania tarentolae TaxID=5689 RepID=A0A640KFP5_LEITA|nr:arp2/3 complex subunit, putative [Leishmania tarentolae]
MGCGAHGAIWTSSPTWKGHRCGCLFANRQRRRQGLLQKLPRRCAQRTCMYGGAPLFSPRIQLLRQRLWSGFYTGRMNCGRPFSFTYTRNGWQCVCCCVNN